MNITFEKHFDITESDLIAVDYLAEKTVLSKQKVKNAMQKGCVWHTVGRNTKRLRRAKKKLSKGSTLHIYYNESVLNTQVPEPKLIADEQHYSVWSKPTGMLSQGSKWGDHCTLMRWSEQHLTPQRNSFLVHRLDRAACGLILVAHTKQAAAKLSRLFQDRQITKQYTAIVEGTWQPTDTLTISLPIDDKAAVSHVTAISTTLNNNTQSQLLVDIDTGRKHQIRRHLSESGHPIVGDRLYGNNNQQVDLRLCAIKLEFLCPISSEIRTYLNEPDW